MTHDKALYESADTLLYFTVNISCGFDLRYALYDVKCWNVPAAKEIKLTGHQTFHSRRSVAFGKMKASRDAGV